jgi:hypothetical protein
MRLHLGCELRFDMPAATPMIALLNVHYSQVPFLERPDVLRSTPAVPLESYRDGFGNWCTRLMAPAGDFTLGTDGVEWVVAPGSRLLAGGDAARAGSLAVEDVASADTTDPTGCGDVWGISCFASLLDGDTVPETARRANRLAAATAAHAGTAGLADLLAETNRSADVRR